MGRGAGPNGHAERVVARGGHVVITDLGGWCFDIDYCRDTHGLRPQAVTNERVPIVAVDLSVYFDGKGPDTDSTLCRRASR